MNTYLSWDRLEDVNGDNTQNRKEISLSFSRTFSPTLTGNIRYAYRTNDADLRESEYDENNVSVYLSKSYR